MQHWIASASEHTARALVCAVCAVLALTWCTDSTAAKWTDTETEVYWSTHRQGGTDKVILQQAVTEFLAIDEAVETLTRRIERITQEGPSQSRHRDALARKAAARAALAKTLKEKPLSPGEEAQLARDLKQAFSQIDPEIAMTFYLRYEGYNWAHTAELLHMSGFTAKRKHPKRLLENIEAGHKALRSQLHRIWERRNQENATQRARLQEAREREFKDEHKKREARREAKAEEIKEAQQARALDCCTVWAQAIASQKNKEKDVPLPDWDQALWTRQVRTSGLPSHTRLVLLTLASHMTPEKGVCTLHMGQLARETGLTLDALTTHLRIAEKSEFLIRSRQKGGRDEAKPVFQAVMQHLEEP